MGGFPILATLVAIVFRTAIGLTTGIAPPERAAVHLFGRRDPGRLVGLARLKGA